MTLISFKVQEDLTNQLVDLLGHYKSINDGLVEKDCATMRGFQTKNIFGYPENYYLKPVIENMLPKKLNLFHMHLIDYDPYGYQLKHNHATTEDYSFILYLNDAERGETVFGKDQTKIKCEKNKMIVFKSDLWHYGKECLTRKKVAVGAMHDEKKAHKR